MVRPTKPPPRVFPRPFTHGGIWGGEKALMGRLMRGDIDLMGGGGNLTLINYIISEKYCYC